MSKWSGAIGYALASEIKPGVWDYIVNERHHVGDLIRNIRRSEGGEKVIDELRLNNSVSVVADAYAVDHFFEMRYITIMGTRWTITTVEVNAPRLVLQIGGVYNGPTPSVA